jgi:hypothetical protein
MLLFRFKAFRHHLLKIRNLYSYGRYAGLLGGGPSCAGPARGEARNQDVTSNHLPVFAKSSANPVFEGLGQLGITEADRVIVYNSLIIIVKKHLHRKPIFTILSLRPHLENKLTSCFYEYRVLPRKL